MRYGLLPQFCIRSVPSRTELFRLIREVHIRRERERDLKCQYPFQKTCGDLNIMEDHQPQKDTEKKDSGLSDLRLSTREQQALTTMAGFPVMHRVNSWVLGVQIIIDKFQFKSLTYSEAKARIRMLHSRLDIPRWIRQEGRLERVTVPSLSLALKRLFDLRSHVSTTPTPSGTIPETNLDDPIEAGFKVFMECDATAEEIVSDYENEVLEI